MILDSTNERIDSLNRNVQEIKNSIHYTQREVDEIKANVSKVSGDHNTVENGMPFVAVWSRWKTRLTISKISREEII